MAAQSGFFLDDPNTDLPNIKVGEEPVSVESPLASLSDVSGGDTSTATAAASQQIEEFKSEGGGKLPVFYGLHVVAGFLLGFKYTAGSPNVLISVIGLGDGRGNFGAHGECEDVVTVWYEGEQQSVSPNSTTDGYRFYRGFISTGVSDVNQPVDAFLPSGIAYSGTFYYIARLSGALADKKRPDSYRALIKGRRVWNFDSTGRFTTHEYSTNPARVAADRILAYYEHKHPNDNTLARKKFQEKIDWESWITWRDHCDQLISWDPGGGAITIKRFECHMVFTDDDTLAGALDRICASSAAHWGDDGKQIYFIPPTEPLAQFHFDATNIISAPRVEPKDLRDRPNYYTAEFRDIRDPFLGLVPVDVRLTELIDREGENKTERAFPPMEWSQTQRVLRWQANHEAENPEICTLGADETSLDVRPGDFVTISHPLTGWPDYQRCKVLAMTINSAEDGPDTCGFTVQKVDDLLYRDDAHGPRQGAIGS